MCGDSAGTTFEAVLPAFALQPLRSAVTILAPQRLPILNRFSARLTREVAGVDIMQSELRAVCVSGTKKALHWKSRARVKLPRQICEWQCAQTGQASTSLRPLSERGDGHAASALHPATPSQLAEVLRRYMPRPVDQRSRGASLLLPSSNAVLRWPNEENQQSLSKSIQADLRPSMLERDTIESASWSVGSTDRRIIYAISGGVAEAVAEQVFRCGYQSPLVDSKPHALARALTLHNQQSRNILFHWENSECQLLFAEGPSEKSRWHLPSLCRQFHGVNLQSRDHAVLATEVGKSSGKTEQRSTSQLVHAASEEIIRTIRLARKSPRGSK